MVRLLGEEAAAVAGQMAQSLREAVVCLSEQVPDPNQRGQLVVAAIGGVAGEFTALASSLFASPERLLEGVVSGHPSHVEFMKLKGLVSELPSSQSLSQIQQLSFRFIAFSHMAMHLKAFFFFFISLFFVVSFSCLSALFVVTS